MANTKVAIIGLGYVGLPLASLLSHSYNVVGYETDHSKVEKLHQGEVTISEPGLEDILREAMLNGNLEITNEAERISESGIKIITVGTPYDEISKNVDYTQLESSLRTVCKHLRKGDIMLLKSTVPPGTSSGMVKDYVESAGFKVPEEIGIVFSPERIVEGQAIRDFKSLPKVIGASDDRSFEAVKELMEHLGGKIIRVSSPEAAETVKMIDNYSRFVFLGLTNEIALMSEKLGVDALEVIFAAKDDYPRNAGILKPGPGVGGSCLNKDPFILQSQLQRRDLDLSMVKAAREVNYGMPFHVIDLVKKFSNGRRNVALLGIAFKGDTDDTRYTPAGQIIEGLEGAGFVVKSHDPFVRKYGKIKIIHSLGEVSNGSDILLLLTDHSDYLSMDLSALTFDRSQKPLIIDTRGIIDRERAERQGFEYHGLGRL